jgi:hypothetical protein
VKEGVLGLFCSAFHAVGDGVEQSSFADASFVLIDHDHAASVTLVAERDLLATGIDGRFVSLATEAGEIKYVKPNTVRHKNCDSW